jgi:hypothetical protein
VSRREWVERSDWTPDLRTAKRYGYPTFWVEVEVPDPEIEALKAAMELMQRLMAEQLDVEEDAS